MKKMCKKLQISAFCVCDNAWRQLEEYMEGESNPPSSMGCRLTLNFSLGQLQPIQALKG